MCATIACMKQLEKALVCHKWQPYHVWFLTTEKSKFWKNEKDAWRYYHFTHVHHKWQSYDVLFMRYWVQQTEIFCHFGPFFALLTPNSKYQNFEKVNKLAGDITILHMCTKINNMMYFSCNMDEVAWQTEFFVILNHFLPCDSLNKPKNQNFEKMKKILETFCTNLPKIMIICYTVP